MEAAIKLMAMSPKYYFQEGWNIFDFAIVTLSLVEFVTEGMGGFTVLRSFRLVRLTHHTNSHSYPVLNIFYTQFILIGTVGRILKLVLSLIFSHLLDLYLCLVQKTY